MMFARNFVAAGVVFAMTAGSVFAQTQAPNADPGVQQRMQNQENRIDQGVKSGALTPKETGNLEAEQARIRQSEERMKSDGTLTGQERQRLRTMQNKADADIYNQKHDAQTAPVTSKPRATIRQRQMNQEQRIEQGVKSGELTPKEAGRLEGEQARIQQTKERMKSDGQLTPAERERLDAMQNKAGQDIYRQKHDAQKAPVTK
jgi:hypothetical protein